MFSNRPTGRLLQITGRWGCWIERCSKATEGFHHYCTPSGDHRHRRRPLAPAYFLLPMVGQTSSSERVAAHPAQGAQKATSREQDAAGSTPQSSGVTDYLFEPQFARNQHEARATDHRLLLLVMCRCGGACSAAEGCFLALLYYCVLLQWQTIAVPPHLAALRGCTRSTEPPTPPPTPPDAMLANWRHLHIHIHRFQPPVAVISTSVQILSVVEEDSGPTKEPFRWWDNPNSNQSRARRKKMQRSRTTQERPVRDFWRALVAADLELVWKCVRP